jgi:sialidase-1
MNVFKNHPSLLPLLLIVAAVFGLDFLTRQSQGQPNMKLSSGIESKALSVLREGLRNQDPEQFWFAMHAAEGLTLGGYGEEVIEVVEPMLATETDGQRLCGIARELARAGDREKVAVLVEVLGREDPYGHIHAAESLYKVIEVGDESVMRERFVKDGPIKLRLMAAGALARKNNDAAAFAFIRECLRGDEPEGIQIAAWLLAVIGEKSDIEPLRSRLPDAPEPIIRAYIEHALASLGDEEGLRLLARNLEDADPVIRTYAATFAGDAKAYSTQSQLEAMLDDSFLDARIRAAQTLLQLSR